MTKHKPSPDTSDANADANASTLDLTKGTHAALSDGLARAETAANPPVDEFGLPILGQDAAPPEDAAAVVDAALVAQIEQDAANAAFMAGVKAKRAGALRVAEEEAARAADAAEEQRLAEEQAERDAMVAVPVPEAVTRLAVLNEMLVRMETAMNTGPEACANVLRAAFQDELFQHAPDGDEAGVDTLCGIPVAKGTTTNLTAWCMSTHLSTWCMSARMAIMRGAA